eukprot:jgi/Mesvir1/26042/Mv26553-RA.1
MIAVGGRGGPMDTYIDDTTQKPPNTLTSNSRVYAKLGNNRFFEVRPAILHFGGYRVGKTHAQKIRVVNVSERSRRLHIIEPATPFFRIKCNKQGLIAPGMCEEVVVEFVPTEWRYYYDTLRIHSEEENLLLPLHAYPVLNRASFPKRLDFGRCVIHET